MKKFLSNIVRLVAVVALLWGANTIMDVMFPPEANIPQDGYTQDYNNSENQGDSQLIDFDGVYFSKDDVALYIHTYGCLPKNFITKDAARDLGWDGGSVEKYAPGCAIGGDEFANREGQLPQGHNYYECDIDTDGYHSRGSRRIVFSDDGLIYYTHDHYETFELLYGEE